MNNKRIIVVLGMHRSGTSALTRSLATFGIGLGERLNPGNFANPKGYWEDEDIMAINEAILQRLGTSYHGLGLIAPPSLLTDAFADLRQRAADVLRANFANTPIWGFKDPRTPRLLPFWQAVFDELGLRTDYVISVRNPLSVAQSLLKRDQFAPVKSHYLWLEHLLGALAATRNARRIVVDYDRLLTEPEAQTLRIGRALDLPAPSADELQAYATEFLDPGLRHTQYSIDDLRADEDVPEPVVKLYALLQELAVRDGAVADDADVQEALDAIRAAWDKLRPLLAYVGQGDNRGQSLEHTRAVQEGVLSGLRQRLNDFDAQVVNYDAAIQKFQEQLEAYERQAQLYARRIAERDSRIASLSAELPRATALAEVLADEKQLAEERAHGAEERAQQANERAQQAREHARHAEARAQQAEDRAQHAEARLRKAEVDLQYLGRTVDDLVERLGAAHQGVMHLAATRLGMSTTLDAVLRSRAWRVSRFLGGGGAVRKPAAPAPAAWPGLPADFDAAVYLDLYPDVATAGLDAETHYMVFGKTEHRPYKREDASAGPSAAQLAAAQGVAPTLDVDQDATGHAQAAPAEPAIAGPQTSADDGTTVATCVEPELQDGFDAAYYLAHNADVREAGLDPYEHYMAYGKAEGRLPRAPDLGNAGTFDTLDPDKETVLLVGHEASRTGAPVLTLNIAQQLLPKYNVVVMLLGPGPLQADMEAAGAIVIGPYPYMRSQAAHATPVFDQLLQQCTIKFALTNSIVCAGVIPELARRDIPTIALIHEFASYTRPRAVFMNAALWAGALVFSTRLTLESAIDEVPCIAGGSLNILPQGRCALPASEAGKEADPLEIARFQDQLRRPDEPPGTVLVMGLGTVQMRKGVDLFIACAEQIVKRDPATPYRFVWIGSGYDPEGDMGYSVYLADQIRRSALGDRIAILPETPHIEAAYACADILMLSSRLDPLPNVGIDAMAHGLPLVCFHDTTGIADVLEDAGLTAECVAPYLDVSGMADRVIALAGSKLYRDNLGARLREVVATRFSMENYVVQLEELALSRVADQRQEQRIAQALASSPAFDAEFVLPPEIADRTADRAAAFYVRGWASGVRPRKPQPGFHPAIYRQAHPELPKDAEPFLHYLEQQRPAGPWALEVIDDAAAIEPVPDTVRIALHIHVFYPDLLEAMVAALAQNQVRPDLFISVPSEAVGEAAAAVLQSYEGNVMRIAVVPNRGRDIGPFLTQFGPELLTSYDLVGHLHTKKTTALADASVGQIWSNFLVKNLLGGTAAMADRILGRMAADPGIGMVFPDDPNVCGWDQNLSYAEPLAQRLGLGRLPEHFNFPVGTMFWARTAAIRPMVELGLSWSDYPAEPLGYDGSVLHAMERLFPLTVQKLGLRILVTHCENVGR